MSIAREVGYAVAIPPMTHGGGITGDTAVYNVHGDPEYGFHISWARDTITAIVEITFFGNQGIPDPAYTGPVESAPYIPDPDGWKPIISTGACGKAGTPLKYLIHPVDADLLAAAQAVVAGNPTAAQLAAIETIRNDYNYRNITDVTDHILSYEDTVMVNCKFPFFRAKTSAGGGYSVQIIGRPAMTRSYAVQELV